MTSANYYTDLGTVAGIYPMRVRNLSTVPLSDVLPADLLDLYQEFDRGIGCRTDALIPRFVKIEINTQDLAEIEVPVKPTIEQLKIIRANLNAITVETVGEKIDYSRLRWLLN